MLPVRTGTLILLMAAAAVGEPVRLHPQNPHYYLFRGKPTVLLTSAEHYGAIINGKFDFIKYLDTLAADNLNLTRIFVGPYRETPGDFGISSNTLGPPAEDYVAPYARSAAPGAKDGRTRFDLARWNPAFFDRLKRFVAAAGERGIVVEVTLFCVYYEDRQWEISALHPANNSNGSPDAPRLEVYTLRHPGLLALQQAFVRKVVAELRDADNVLYEIINEPYTRGATTEWQRAISQTIRDAEAGFAARHLIAQNIANFTAKAADVDPNVGVLNFHYARPPAAVAANYAAGRVIGLDETGFDGTLDAVYRMQAWDFIIAGGAHYNNLDYSFTVGHEDGTYPVPGTAPGGGGAGLRAQLKILRAFLDRLDLVRCAPAADLVARVPPDISVRALAERGGAIAVYVHTGRVMSGYRPRYIYRTQPGTVSFGIHLPAGSYSAEWMNPRTGQVVRKDTVEHSGGIVTLVTPEFSEDLALRLAER